MRHAIVVCLAAMCCSVAGNAQTVSQTDLSTVLKRLDAVEHRVQDLEQQNAALRAQLSGTPPPSEAPVQTAMSKSAPAKDHDQMGGTTPEGHETYPNLHLRGFADVDFSATNIKGQPSGFNLGQFVLHMSSPLSKKVSVFGELSFTARSNQYSVEVERSIVRYDANDYFKLSFGKYHTPVNYWNTAFHHGAWLQTTISRPEMIQFGGRFLPVHFVGLEAEGAIPSGSLGLNYNLGIGNGRQTPSLLARDGDAGDVNGNRAVVAELFARPTQLFGLQVGASFYKDKVTPDAGTAAVALGPYREWIASGHIVWSRETPEFITEFVNVHHTNIASGRDWNSQGVYTQLAYRLPGVARAWKPYYRYEYIHVPATEPVLLVPNLSGHTAGVRYDITDYAAFKVEYRSSRRSPTLRTDGLFLQTAFTF